MRIKFTAPAWKSKNYYNKLHWAKKRKEKEDYFLQILAMNKDFLAIKFASPGYPIKEKFDLYVGLYFIDNRKRDKQNYMQAEFLFDFLQWYGIIENDNQFDGYIEFELITDKEKAGLAEVKMIWGE